VRNFEAFKTASIMQDVWLKVALFFLELLCLSRITQTCYENNFLPWRVDRNGFGEGPIFFIE